MDSFEPGKALIYKSSNMMERRRRILKEVRNVIAETNSTEFSVDELCARAGVAKGTFYNAFGSKENVIAIAIQQYVEDHASRVHAKNGSETLEGRLERLIQVCIGMRLIRSYTSAVFAVYNSPTADPALRATIRKLATTSQTAFVDHLKSQGALAEGVDSTTVLETIASTIYALESDWCHGDLPDDLLVERICEVYLIVIAGFTSGEACDAARAWLEALRSRSDRWLKLVMLASEPPRKARARAAQG